MMIRTYVMGGISIVAIWANCFNLIGCFRLLEQKDLKKSLTGWDLGGAALMEAFKKSMRESDLDTR